MRKQSNVKKNTTSTITTSAPWRLISVKPQKDYKLEVEFNDGLIGVVEVKRLVMRENAGVFLALRDVEQFNRVYLSDGVVTWPGNIDLAPDAMYDEIKQQGRWVLK